jgi:hypothetical protein
VEPVEVSLHSAASLKAAPSVDAEDLAQLPAGETFRLLESKLGWAWGYTGPKGQVGYVRADALGLD